MYEIKNTETGEIQFIDTDLLKYIEQRNVTEVKVEEIERKNLNFTQFDNTKLRNELPRLATSNKYAMAVFLVLASLSGATNGVVCSQTEISEISGLIRSRVSEGVAHLITMQLIKRYRLRGGGTLFALSEKYVWKSKLSGKRYSLFNEANVVLSTDKTTARRITKTVHIAVSDITPRVGADRITFGDA